MLSEEEKKLLKIFKAQVEKEETEYFSVNVYTQLLYDSHKTVSNLITKLQKENEKYKYLYQKAMDNTVKSDKENIQLKKQIDLMAELVYKRFKAELLLEYGFENEEQLKQYFADLVEKE